MTILSSALRTVCAQNPPPVLHHWRPVPTPLTHVVLAFVLLRALKRSFQCRLAFGLVRTKTTMHVRGVWHAASSSKAH